MYRIGIDIGGTKVNIGLFDILNKRLLATDKTYIKDISCLRSHIADKVKLLCSQFGLTVNDIKGCGIGIPGTVSDDGRYILKAPNISILPEDIAPQVEEALGIRTRLVQDSRAAAYGEYKVCPNDHKVLVCVTLGTGIGTGIVINGEIFAGGLGAAGELGHLPVREQGRACGCGKVGCLEKYCAGGGLDITAAEILGAGKSAPDLFKAAEQGNADAISAISDAIKMLGAGLVSIVNLLSPDCLLFSGGLSERTEYLEPIIEYIRAHCYSAGKMPEISKARLGEYSPLYGAAFIAE